MSAPSARRSPCLPARPRPAAGAARPGFSLIEVLIAVLVLALGLLGLGAVFPVVIREQRAAYDSTVGVLAAESARAQLELFVQPQGAYDQSGQTPASAAEAVNVWQSWRDDNRLGGLRDPLTTNQNSRGAWIIPRPPQGFSAPASYGPTDGNIVLGSVSNNQTDGQVVIPVRARLFPSDAETFVQTGTPTSVPPQFVWDMAVQRAPDDPSGATLRVAVFIRRLDGRIRRPDARTPLRQVLTGQGQQNASDHRFPVGVDAATGLPTGDGTGVYAYPRTVGVKYIYDQNAAPNTPRGRRDYLFYGGAGVPSTDWTLARQIGQKLVDNLGNLYTVVRYGDDTPQGDGPWVQVTPGVPGDVFRTSVQLDANRPLVQGVASMFEQQVLQVVFTPQVPAQVLLYTVTPPLEPASPARREDFR